MLNHDSSVHRIMSLITDIVLIGVLWTLMSIPIFTIGASTTASYYVFTKSVSGRDSYLIKDFFNSFLKNFFKSTAIFIILAVGLILLSFNISILQSENFIGWAILMINYFLIVQITFIFIYIFPLLARFDSPFFVYFKQAAFLANRHILFTIAILLMLAFLIILSMYLSFLILFAMGIYCYLSSCLIVKIFKKHRPEFDAPIGEQEKNETRIIFDKTSSYSSD